MRKLSGSGSGAIISRDGYVVTNHHVAGNAGRIVCNLADQEELEAELVGTDALADIAVLKLELSHRKKGAKPLPVAEWGDSDKIRVGDVVFAMGSPAAVSQSVTRGIVSNTQLIMPRSMSGAFRLDGENVGSIVRWLAHDAVIFGGNSGGPLVNVAGRIVGINEIGLGSLGGAIPSNLARSVVEQIVAGGHVKRSWTGMEVQPRLKSGAAEAGVLVAGVVKDSPAEAAGLKAGDVMTTFDGSAVDCGIGEQLPLFNQLVLATPIGKTVEIKLLRDGKAKRVSLTTIAREPALPRPEEVKSWGIAARNLTRMMALERRRADKDGALVHSIRAGGPCGDAKPNISPGDVIRKINGKSVKDLAALRKLTAEATKGRTDPVPVLVDYDRGTRKLLTVVKVGKQPAADKPALARKPWPAVGTQVLTRDLAESLGMKGKTGVRVTEVYSGRAGEKAGIEVGDIILADGIEIPARVVLKDEDLDMAFIMPKDKLEKEAAEQIVSVDLSKGAAKAARLDEVIRLSRLGKDLNRELVIELDRISAVITKPRTFYILGAAKPGTPVFAADGELLGIIVFHKKPGSGSASRGGANVGGTPVVLPTKDVKKIADQAREEMDKAPTTKDADSKESADE